MKTFKLTAQPDSFVVHRINGDGLDELQITGFDIEVSDGYHTMHELYQHRMALNIALFNAWNQSILWGNVENDHDIKVMKSKLHYDGTMFEGYFIVIAITDVGQISYHYKLKHWDKFRIPEVDKIPIPFDGHGSMEVIERLMRL